MNDLSRLKALASGKAEVYLLKGDAEALRQLIEAYEEIKFLLQAVARVSRNLPVTPEERELALSVLGEDH